VIALDGRSAVEVYDESQYADPLALGTRAGARLNALGAQTIIEETRYIG
jgi:hydroxymethylbilane synthase